MLHKVHWQLQWKSYKTAYQMRMLAPHWWLHPFLDMSPLDLIGRPCWATKTPVLQQLSHGHSFILRMRILTAFRTPSSHGTTIRWGVVTCWSRMHPLAQCAAKIARQWIGSLPLLDGGKKTLGNKWSHGAISWLVHVVVPPWATNPWKLVRVDALSCRRFTDFLCPMVFSLVGAQWTGWCKKSDKT